MRAYSKCKLVSSKIYIDAVDKINIDNSTPE